MIAGVKTYAGYLASQILRYESLDYVEVWIELGKALEICPTHRCAIEICMDDEAVCDAGEFAARRNEQRPRKLR